MKTLIFLLCCVTIASAQNQSLDTNAGEPTVSTNSPSQAVVGYQTGVQDGNSRVWQKIVQITDNQGNVTYQTNNAYTELATGLNHLVNGQWVASKEEIDISADGNSALATNGQHQAYFPGDIYSGQIELVTPDGKQLYSRPVGLSYFDGTNSVLIAELTNSTGEVVGNNQVLYSNAFTGFAADIRYTYTKAGFEQDIIVREQPPSPASFGLNPETTTLQVLTEFFDPPQPTVNATTVPTDAGNLENDNLDFGVMQMIPGKAFLLGTTTPSVEVNKQWLTLDGRQMLVEEVPFVSIAGQLENLPFSQTTSTQPNTPLNVVSTKRLLPIQRIATVPNKHPMQLAQVAPSTRGLVLDYVTMTSQTNYTFRGDTTYYISGTVNLYQTNTFEGGAVLKYTNNASVNLESGNVLHWQAAAYRPVIFTAKDDNSVGDAISGSTGSPTNYYANPALNFNGGSSVSYFRIAWASQAVSVAGSATISLYNGQVVNCLNGITFSYGTMNVRNLLFANVQTNFNNLNANNLSVQNSTFNGSACVIQGPDYSSPIFTNCIFANVTSLTAGTVSSFSGTSNGFYICQEFGTGRITNSFYPFQTVGAGNYYLTNGCAFTNAGTASIDPTLLTNLQQKTTYPPLLLTNRTFSVNTNLSPQALRDTNSSPNLGYHYDPLDYCWNNLNLTNATMTLTNGVAIGVYGYIGLTLQNGATLISQGTPLIPNQLVNYHSVQEQTNLLGATNTACTYLNPTATNSVIRLRFTDVSTVAMPHDTIYVVGGTGLNSFNLMDCQVSAMLIYIWDSLVVSPGYVGITNNIFWRSHLDFGNLSSTYPLNFYNNLCFGGESDFYGGSGWNVKNNLFDTVTTAAWTGVVNDYNGYYNATELSGAGGDDQIITKDDYQTVPLGNYYYPTNGYYNLSWLLNSGSTTASVLGLYHYTMTTNEAIEATNIVSIGYHYVATDTNGNPIDTFTNGIPDYLYDAGGSLGVWELKYFGNIGVDINSDYDGDGHTLLYDYTNGIDPNIISFSFSVTNQYVSTNIVTGVITILGGVPSSIAVLVDSTNFTGATWTAYTSSNVTVNLGSTQGSHDVWIGLRGLPSSAQQTWEESTFVLDSTTPTVSITNPVNNVSLNSSRVDVSGNFTAASLKQITVNGVLAFASGTNFDVLNVPLSAGTNVIIAVIEDFTGTTNTASINVIGLTNSDGSMNSPVQLQATPVAGFAPLTVAFTIQTNVPGTIEQAFYDFNGDDIADFVTNNLSSLNYTYATNGEYFPVVTIQTTVGRFSSIGGWNAVALDPSNLPVQINVQSLPAQTTFASITDPVDIKYVAPSNLYVLSGSTATITEFSTNGSVIRSLSSIGSSPSGLDVDATGNVYVAITGNNQVWKFNPTNSSFIADTNFGIGGVIGLTNGVSGTNSGEFNAPFDVAVSPDGGTISVSDSGNDRIQQFLATNGMFIASFGTNGSAVGQFNTPKGLTYDSVGTLYIVDSGNNRIALAVGTIVQAVTGTGGTALTQLSGPVNISTGERAVYVADTGNNRVQSFSRAAPNSLFSIDPSSIRFAISSGLNAPAAVAAVDSLTNEMYYVADTGNNRILLYTVPNSDLGVILAVWNNMTNRIAAGDISGAASNFSIATADNYRQAWTILGLSTVNSDINQIGPLTPVFIQDDTAEYYFEQTIDGQPLLFPVEFDRENGIWKIMDF